MGFPTLRNNWVLRHRIFAQIDGNIVIAVIDAATTLSEGVVSLHRAAMGMAKQDGKPGSSGCGEK